MATASTDIDQLRAELDEIGARRKANKDERGQIAKDAERVLRRAYGKIPVEEAAQRTGMHRTTLYRVYHPHDG